MTYSEAEQLFEKNEIEKTFDMLNQLIELDTSNKKALLLRGRIFYKMQKWGEAMNDYNAVLDLDPLNLEAKSGIEMAKNILGYFTPEMFNP